MPKVASRACFVETTVLTAAISAIFLIFSRLGVDPHHDGMVMQPALVVADGGVVHKDVFEQYGAITPWLHALAVNIFGRTLVVVRASSAICLASAISFLFAAWRRLYGRGAAYISLASVLATSYFFTPGLDMRAWSSDSLILIQSICLWWLCSRTLSKLTVWILGFLSGIAVFCRLGPGVAQVMLFLVVLGALRRDRVLAFLTGLSASVGAVCGYLYLSGALNEMWYQTVVMPANWSLNSLHSTPLSFAWALLKDRIGPILICVLLICIVARNPFPRHSTSPGKFAVWFVVATAGLWLIMTLNFGGFLGRRQFPWLVFTLALVAVTANLFNVPATPGRYSDRLVLAVVPLASLSQVYPVVEARHLWWAVAPATGLAYSATQQLLQGRQSRFLALSVASLTLGYGLAIDVTANVALKRVRVSNNSVLNGMYFDAEYFEYFEENLDTLQAYRMVHPNTPMVNMCVDGLFASLTASSVMPDPYYVLWSFRANDISFENRAEWALKVRPIAWFCPPSPDENAQAGLFGLRVVPVSSRTTGLPLQDQWPYKSALAVPREWPVPKGARG